VSDPAGPAPALLARVVRDGFVESVHLGHVVVTSAAGDVLGALGDAGAVIYPRSSLKPFQGAAVVALLAEAGMPLDDAGVAIACASHAGSAEQQIEAARLLAIAGLCEDALQCPPAHPADLAALQALRSGPDRLSHNCSGKHAAFLLAQVVRGDDPATYLHPSSGIQRRVCAALAEHSGAALSGPGVDGCGAPAWRMPLAALATSFARLASAGSLARVAAAMRARPDLVGGPEAHDTLLMLADARVVAKRGAEAVFGAGISLHGEAAGVAVKIADGGARAPGPVGAAVLAAFGADVPAAVAAPPVLGGGRVHGRLEVDAAVAALVAPLAS
jgi:L-asparaginase II